jgi:hypothetical protein
VSFINGIQFKRLQRIHTVLAVKLTRKSAPPFEHRLSLNTY